MCRSIGTAHSETPPYSQVKTSTSGSTLVAKGSTDPVRVAQVALAAEMTSYLPDSAFDSLKYFTAESATGNKVIANAYACACSGECDPVADDTACQHVLHRCDPRSLGRSASKFRAT